MTVMQPVRMPTRPYPMSKIVGQDMVKLALLLAAGENTADGSILPTLVVFRILLARVLFMCILCVLCHPVYSGRVYTFRYVWAHQAWSHGKVTTGVLFSVGS